MGDHFDPQLQTWEPMLRGVDRLHFRETGWSVHFAAARVGDLLRVDVIAKRVLSVCVTQSLVDSMRRVYLELMGRNEKLLKTGTRVTRLLSLATLRENVRADIQEIRRASARPTYVLLNSTGQDMRWSIGHDAPKDLQSRRERNVAIWVPSDIEMCMNLIERNTLSLFLERGQNPWVKRLPIDGPRVMCFPFGSKQTLVYEIRYEEGLRLLEVRSNVQFVSQLRQISVTIFCDGEEAGVLEAHGVLSLPLPSANGRITFGSPSGDILDLENVRKGTLVSLDGVLQRSLHVRGRTDETYALLLTGTPDELYEGAVSWSIAVKAPLLIRNLLATDLFLRFRGVLDVDVEDQVCIKRGESCELLFHAEEIAIRYNGFDWSPFAALRRVTEFMLSGGGDVRVENLAKGVIGKDNDRSSQMLTFWSPFWLINNTDHVLMVDELEKVPFLERGVPYMFGGSTLHVGMEGERPRGRQGKIRAKLEFGYVHAAGVIAIDVVELGVSVYSASGAFWRTKIVQLNDRYHVINMCDKRICMRQLTTEQEVFVAPGEQVWYHWHSMTAPHWVSVRIGESGWLWSGVFEIKDVSLFDVNIYTETGVRTRVTVQTTTDALITGIIFRAATPEFSFYRIVNSTRLPFLLRQFSVDMDPGEWLNPRDSIPFAWYEPGKSNLLAVLDFPGAVIRNKEGKVFKDEDLPMFMLDTVTNYCNFTYQGRKMQQPVPLDIRVYFKGATKVFEVAEATPHVSEEHICNVVELSFSLQLGGIGVSVINSLPREVMHAEMTNLRATYEDGTRETLYSIDVARVQVDNMLHNATFPIVLWPKNPLHKSFLHVAANVAKGHEGIIFLNGVEFVVQEAEMRVDEAFAGHMASVVGDMIWLFQVREIDWKSLTVPVPDFRKMVYAQAELMYARFIYIGPLSMGYSYSTSPQGKETLANMEDTMVERYFNYWDQTFLYDANAVHCNLQALYLEDVYHPPEVIYKMVSHHYLWQSVRNMFRFLGAVPVLGAPTELFRGVAGSVRVALIKPAQSVVRSPVEFGDQLRERSKVLFQGTVGAFFKELSKGSVMTSSVASRLTFDDDYRRKRLAVAKFKAKSPQQGMLFAARDIGTGLWKAVTGVVVNPVEGARTGGAAGFGKGLGIGVIGLATKPVVGVMDAVSHISQGIQNATLVLRPRMRHTRQFDQTHSVLAYNFEAAQAQEVLVRVEKSHHAKAIAAFFYPGFGLSDRSGGKSIDRRSHVLISSKAVFALSGRELGTLSLQWRVSLTDINWTLVKDTIVIVVTRLHQELHELRMSTHAEAILVCRKVNRALNAEMEQTLAAPAPGAATALLIENLEERKVEASFLLPERSLVQEDKGKDEVW